MYRPTKAKLPHLNQEYQSDFDTHPIYSQMGGWVVDKDSGMPKYKLDKLDWSKKLDGSASVLTGADGDVMVKVPAFSFRYNVETQGFEMDSIIPNREGTNLRDGFIVHPAFLTLEGKVKPYVWVGAYKGSVIGSQLRSVSGVLPAVSATIATFTDRARQGRNTGENWHDITRWYELSALQMLFVFEFGSLNSQDVCGRGWVNMTSACASGTTDSLGDRSGYLGENGKSAMRWRGIENFWGNVWEFVTGFMVSDIGYHTTNDPSKFLKMNEMELSAKDLSVKVLEGFVKEMEKISGKEFMFIPKVTSGSESTYYSDYCWTHDPTESNICL
ncbi:MAG: hypothetical protein ACRCZ0_09915, partial [Cetobacterium sp.]